MSDNNKKNAYRYFIYNMQEYLKIDYRNLENRRMDSFRALLLDFLDLSNEINNNIGDKTKYQKSLQNLMETITFYCKENPISKHPYLKEDLHCLRVLLEKDKKDAQCIYNTINSIYKKMNSLNTLSLCIDIIEDYTENFSDVDKLTEAYISELIFEGYSLKYLEEWWGKTFRSEVMKGISDEKGLRDIIEKCRELSHRENTYFEIILKIWLPNEIKKELQDYGKLTISNVEYKKADITTLKNNKDFDKFFESNKFEFLKVSIKSCDKYKSIELAKLPLENYIEIYRVINPSIKEDIVNGCLVKQDETFEEITLHNDLGYTGKMTGREKEDIQDFIELRDIQRQKNMMSFDIHVIERVINLLQKMPELTRENRLLNTWTCLEYILKFYNKDSIIEKVREIVPRVICLYFVKNKLNILWDKLLPFIEKGSLTDLSQCISSENGKKYNKEAFTLFLKDMDNAKKLCNCFNTNISIQRKIQEINCILNRPDTLLNMLNYTYNSVMHDLNSIYRLRNKLVHSGGTTRVNIELYSDKLQKYVNCILGTVIYHIKRSPESTISEILYSIIQTYDEYIDFLEKLTKEENPVKLNESININIKKIAYPPYLYL